MTKWVGRIKRYKKTRNRGTIRFCARRKKLQNKTSPRFSRIFRGDNFVYLFISRRGLFSSIFYYEKFQQNVKIFIKVTVKRNMYRFVALSRNAPDWPRSLLKLYSVMIFKWEKRNLCVFNLIECWRLRKRKHNGVNNRERRRARSENFNKPVPF